MSLPLVLKDRVRRFQNALHRAHAMLFSQKRVAAGQVIVSSDLVLLHSMSLKEWIRHPQSWETETSPFPRLPSLCCLHQSINLSINQPLTHQVLSRTAGPHWHLAPSSSLLSCANSHIQFLPWLLLLLWV